MAMPLTFLLLGGLGLGLALADKASASGKKPTTQNPFAHTPDSHKGMKFHTRKVKAKSGRRYTTESTAPAADDRVYVVVQREKTLTTKDGVKHRPWLSYLHHRQTGKRKVHRAFAAGSSSTARDARVQEMMSDFGLKG